MRRITIFLHITLLPVWALAQNLNGIWKGTLTLGPGGCFSVYNIEMQISVHDEVISGVTYHYSDVRNYVKEDFEGSYNSKQKSLVIREKNVLTFHVPPDCIPCIKTYKLAYLHDEKKEVLTGEMGGRMMGNNGACPPGRIELSRIRESEFDHIKEIRVDTGTIRLDFYDNAEIDDDTISVMLNNSAIVTHQRLSLKPITVEIKVDLDNREQEVVMIGENLGTIPPNTALLIVTAGNKRYQLFLTSTAQKSATVRFIYEKPK